MEKGDYKNEAMIEFHFKIGPRFQPRLAPLAEGVQSQYISEHVEIEVYRMLTRKN